MANQNTPGTEQTSTFGFNQIGKQTPSWAKIAFRITVVVTSVLVFVIASIDRIPATMKMEFAVYLKAIDMLVLGLSRMFGIDLEPANRPNE